jgi:hypothetical protein
MNYSGNTDYATLNPSTTKEKSMTVTELEKITTLYKVGQMLNLTYPAVYKWRKTNKIPALRLFQLKEMKPEWFEQTEKV